MYWECSWFIKLSPLLLYSKVTRLHIHTHSFFFLMCSSITFITGYWTQCPVLHSRAGDGCEESGPVFLKRISQSNWLDSFFTVRPRLNFGSRIRLQWRWGLWALHGQVPEARGAHSWRCWDCSPASDEAHQVSVSRYHFNLKNSGRNVHV